MQFTIHTQQLLQQSVLLLVGGSHTAQLQIGKFQPAVGGREAPLPVPVAHASSLIR